MLYVLFEMGVCLAIGYVGTLITELLGKNKSKQST